MYIKSISKLLILGGLAIIFTNCSSGGISTGTMYNIEKSELKSYIKKANQGDLLAIKKLENFYVFIEEDSNKSMFYLKLGTKLYDKESLNNYLFSLKEKKRKDEIKKCISWLENLADENNTFAQRALYELYSKGKYIDKNSDKANGFLKKLENNLKENSW